MATEKHKFKLGILCIGLVNIVLGSHPVEEVTILLLQEKNFITEEDLKNNNHLWALYFDFQMGRVSFKSFLTRCPSINVWLCLQDMHHQFFNFFFVASLVTSSHFCPAFYFCSSSPPWNDRTAVFTSSFRIGAKWCALTTRKNTTRNCDGGNIRVVGNQIKKRGFLWENK